MHSNSRLDAAIVLRAFVIATGLAGDPQSRHGLRALREWKAYSSGYAIARSSVGF
jgi:hypothetical protein